ncbi:MAG: helix-turn-helix domain-containing protein [Candidatus Paracaedibacteraceae bacterium]|nr:helix-turn-helix domain-containing protein [Candidatus Paracaedibacteraceae bacterium]
MNKTKNERQRARLKWVELYKQVKNTGIVCRKCGISRPTLRKWLRHYEEKGKAGLEEHSRKPCRSPSINPNYGIKNSNNREVSRLD